jgi:hypothetical protein
VTLGTVLGPSLMLLPGYWNDKAGGQQLTAAIPTTGAVIWIANATEDEIAGLRNRVIAEHAAAEVETVCFRREAECSDWKLWGQVDNVEALSPELFRWTGTGWEVLPE